ncbi:MAG TPA: sensor histidine kinase, partial [Thermomicrobiales bacterium]|nr:sensor histidine kinase [Thermomicrobiales bacterium]
HLFDRFYRADISRTTGGSGLGLAIARQIVTQHGGDITAASVVGEGTTFTITLPKLDNIPRPITASTASNAAS